MDFTWLTEKFHNRHHTNIGAVHEGKKPFQCYLCVHFSKTKGHLDMHIASVHEKKRPFRCEFCSSGFFTRGHLQRHISAVHEKVKSNMCHLCSLSFAAKFNLRAHIKQVHEKIKKWNPKKYTVFVNPHHTISPIQGVRGSWNFDTVLKGYS